MTELLCASIQMCILVQFGTRNSLVFWTIIWKKIVQLHEKTAFSYACECGILGSPFFHLQIGYIKKN
jgi:hypothetical protein